MNACGLAPDAFGFSASGLALGAGGVEKHQQAHTKQQEPTQSHRSPHDAAEAHNANLSVNHFFLLLSAAAKR